MLKKAAAFLADASSDSIRLSARAAALSNTARRALWLKNWRGDVNFKSKLCAIPCEGEFQFGSVLDEILERAGDKGKVFPSTSSNRQYLFRGTDRNPQSRKRRQDTPRVRGGGVKVLEVLCTTRSLGQVSSLENDASPAVGGRLRFLLLHYWERISNNQWVLGILREGLKIPFQSAPRQDFLYQKFQKALESQPSY